MMLLLTDTVSRLQDLYGNTYRKSIWIDEFELLPGSILVWIDLGMQDGSE